MTPPYQQTQNEPTKKRPFSQLDFESKGEFAEASQRKKKSNKKTALFSCMCQVCLRNSKRDSKTQHSCSFQTLQNTESDAGLPQGTDKAEQSGLWYLQEKLNNSYRRATTSTDSPLRIKFWSQISPSVLIDLPSRLRSNSHLQHQQKNNNGH